MVEPCAQEGLFGLMKQESPRVHWKAFTSPGLACGIGSAWVGVLGPGSVGRPGVRNTWKKSKGTRNLLLLELLYMCPAHWAVGEGSSLGLLVLGYVPGRGKARLASL